MIQLYIYIYIIYILHYYIFMCIYIYIYTYICMYYRYLAISMLISHEKSHEQLMVLRLNRALCHEARELVRWLSRLGSVHELCGTLWRSLSQWTGHRRMDGQCQGEGHFLTNLLYSYMPEKNGKEPIKSLYTMFKYIYNHIYIYIVYMILSIIT